MALERAGYEVALAVDGAEAIAAVRGAGFDLVLMDVDMPVMDGLAAARGIRALDGPRSKVPILAISGDGQSLLAAGMNDYIRKPFRKADLLLKVDAWLKRDPPEPPSASVPEKSTAFQEALELMGRPWALRGLITLEAQIGEAFGTDSGGARNQGQLVSQAHALASLAAILGFSDLSERCSTLEEACKRGQGVQPPFESARRAALEARTAAIALISNLQIEAS